MGTSSRIKNSEHITEIGFVRLARVALEIAEAVLPDYYRTKFSQHVFTQPQLLAVSALYATKTEPCARPRFGWPSMASCGGLWDCARHPTRLHFIASCGGSMVGLGGCLGRNCPPFTGFKPRSAGAICHRVAVDATRLTPGVLSTFYVQRILNRNSVPLPWRRWLTWPTAVARLRESRSRPLHQAHPASRAVSLRGIVVSRWNIGRSRYEPFEPPP